MSFTELNDALQRATPPHTWVAWHSMFDGTRHVDEVAMLCNCRSHAVLGRASEGYEALAAKIPDMAKVLR